MTAPRIEWKHHRRLGYWSPVGDYEGKRRRVAKSGRKYAAYINDRLYATLATADAAKRAAEEGLLEVRLEVREPPSLAAAARAAGHEPETEEGGRAMMQAITPEHLHRAEAVRKMRTLKPGDEIKYTNYTIGGSYEGTAVVTWDHGKSVEARTLGGERLRLERAQDGSLRRFT